MHIVKWIVANQDLLYVVVALALALLRATKWGKANATALTAVTGAVEEAQACGVKALVAERVATLNPAVVRAVADAVNTVSPDKPTPSPLVVFLRELLPFAKTPPPVAPKACGAAVGATSTVEGHGV